jgi:hypothetical protein
MPKTTLEVARVGTIVSDDRSVLISLQLSQFTELRLYVPPLDCPYRAPTQRAGWRGKRRCSYRSHGSALTDATCKRSLATSRILRPPEPERDRLQSHHL